MQTFLPHPNFASSAWCLDYRRLGKQRLEADQLYRLIMTTRATYLRGDDGRHLSTEQWRCATRTEEGRAGWGQHPATLMWRNHLGALALYHDIIILEWVRRGYKNEMTLIMPPEDKICMPDWLGSEEFHASHRSRLLEKDPDWYSQFGWEEEPGREYVWPI